MTQIMIDQKDRIKGTKHKKNLYVNKESVPLEHLADKLLRPGWSAIIGETILQSMAAGASYATGENLIYPIGFGASLGVVCSIPFKKNENYTLPKKVFYHGNSLQDQKTIYRRD